MTAILRPECRGGVEVVVTQTLGQLIREAREARGGSQGYLAARLGVGHVFIGTVERGLQCITRARLPAVAKALDLPLRKLEGLRSVFLFAVWARDQGLPEETATSMLDVLREEYR